MVQSDGGQGGVVQGLEGPCGCGISAGEKPGVAYEEAPGLGPYGGYGDCSYAAEGNEGNGRFGYVSGGGLCLYGELDCDETGRGG